MTAGLKDVALVLAAHGDRGGLEPNAILRAHVRALEDAQAFHSVFAGTLKSDDLAIECALDKAARSGAARIALYPLFMADGYFTGTVLPDRVASAGIAGRCTVLPPLGLDPQLPDVMMQQAVEAAAALNLDPLDARLLVVGHGSKVSRASFQATEKAACRLRRAARFAVVETAYLEEEPFLADRLKATAQLTLVSGFFSGDGLHAAEDVPGAIAASGAHAFYAGAVASHPAVAMLISQAVSRVLVPGAAA